MVPELLFLDQIKYNLKYVDYDSIYHRIADLRVKFIPTALIKKGHYIERARINYNEEIFTRQEQVSYISDPEVLKHRVKFGRANMPSQSVFYGSIISPEIEIPRAVTYFETSSRIKELSVPGPFKELFTVSRWRVLETFEVVEIIYGESYQGKSEYVRLALQNQEHNLNALIDELKQTKNQDFTEHFEQQSKLFCNEFAKTDIVSPDDYKISVAYANYIWSKTQLKGVTYPSVPSNYQGQNLALLPEVVDTFLKLETVYMCSCERDYDEHPVVKIHNRLIA